jgi:fructosamine-3-kinase
VSLSPEPAGLAAAVSPAVGVGVIRVSPCPGGDINRAAELELEGGVRAFLKFRPGAPVEEFADEAAGLAWLGEPGALRVPHVLAVIEAEGWSGLLLEWVESAGRLSGDVEECFGRGLATIHAAGAGRHGDRAPGTRRAEIHLGEAVLAAPPERGPDPGFAELYATRIEDLARQAVGTGGLDRAGVSAVSSLADAIDRHCGPAVPPARLHGDLWQGNVMDGGRRGPWLIDPAPYGGHPEVDLAMLELFGSPSARFYGA